MTKLNLAVLAVLTLSKLSTVKPAASPLHNADYVTGSTTTKYSLVDWPMY